MNKIAINTFDVRLSYLTEKEIEQWNSLNQLARTLWFENTISGPRPFQVLCKLKKLT